MSSGCALRAATRVQITFKSRHGKCRSRAMGERRRFVARAVRRSPISLALSTCNLSTMSDLCPVYAPFFGAMVSPYCELLHLMSSIDLSATGLYQCHRVYMYVLFPVPYILFSTHLLGIGARQVFFVFSLACQWPLQCQLLKPQLIIDFAL